MTTSNDNIYPVIWQALTESDIERKLNAVYTLYYSMRDGLYSRQATTVKSLPDAGRPARPELISPKDLPRRRLGSPEGIIAMLHAIAHIEFNAVNLALDAAYRFQDMPKDYCTDWLLVAKEEAYHFSLIRARLHQLGAEYGDLPAHAGLWQACCDTEHDVMVRMALVPRVMEARGLDVTPMIQHKLRQHGEQRSAELLDIIYRDEHGHVAIGSKWFKYCCSKRGLDYRETFAELLSGYLKAHIKGPFNIEARLQAGFDDLELTMLGELEKRP